MIEMSQQKKQGGIVFFTGNLQQLPARVVNWSRSAGCATRCLVGWLDSVWWCLKPMQGVGGIYLLTAWLQEQRRTLELGITGPEGREMCRPELEEAAATKHAIMICEAGQSINGVSFAVLHIFTFLEKPHGIIEATTLRSNATVLSQVFCLRLSASVQLHSLSGLVGCCCNCLAFIRRPLIDQSAPLDGTYALVTTFKAVWCLKRIGRCILANKTQIKHFFEIVRFLPNFRRSTCDWPTAIFRGPGLV